jgi:hypothetical protein
VRRGRQPRGERGILVVPVRPGGAYGPLTPAAPPAHSRRRLLVTVGAAAVIALLAYGGVQLVHAPGRAQVARSPAPVRSIPTHRTAKPQPTPQQRAHAAALRLVARLPVTIGSAALLRRGAIAYLVGGEPRLGGKPTDGVWRIDLATGRVRAVGHFIEPLADAGSASRAGVLYLAGGWTGEKVATAVLRWSPGGVATVVARLPVGLRRATAGFDGAGRLFVAGGSPRKVFVVDIGSGKVGRAATLPRKLRGKDSNLDYPVQSRASYR